jgi:hypothetical protein
MSDGRKSEFITEFIYLLPDVTAKLTKKQGWPPKDHPKIKLDGGTWDEFPTVVTS